MLGQMQAAFCANYGLTPSPKLTRHDAVHYLAGLGPSPDEEDLIDWIYQPIIYGKTSAEDMRYWQPFHEEHIEKAEIIRQQYGHLF